MTGRQDPLELLSVRQLSDLWQVHPQTVRVWIRTGALRSVQLGRRRLVPRAAAEEFQNGSSPADDNGAAE